MTLTQLERPAFAKRWLAERLEAMADGMSQAKVQAIVRRFVEFERAAHLEAEPAADEHEGNVVQRVRVAFAQLVGPDNKRVVEHRACAAGFGRACQPLRQVGQLAAEPLINLYELVLLGLFLVRFM